MSKTVIVTLIVFLVVIASFASGYIYSSSKWSAVIKDKENNITRLTTELDNTKEELDKLRVKYEDLSRERDNLSLRIKLLEQELGELHYQKKLLEENLSLALDEISKKSEMIDDLTKQLEEAYSQISRLEEEAVKANETIDQLRGDIGELEQQLNYTNTMLAELNETLENITAWYWLAPEEEEYSFIDNILAESYTEVIDEASKLNATNEDAGYKTLAVIEYLLLNTYYQWDHYARLYYPWNKSIIAWNDMISLPNETIWAEGGDCEDLAIYAYKLLSSLGGFSELYLLMWFNGSMGHVAVLAVASNGYYIIDPAGDYVNGYTVLLELQVEDYQRRDTWYYYMSPLSLEPTVKHSLLDNDFARIVYMDVSSGVKYYSSPNIRAYSSPLSLLDDWISYWGVEPVRLEIHSIGVHESFNTTADLASWLEGGR